MLAVGLRSPEWFVMRWPTEKSVLTVASGSSVSMRFKSCENKFVVTPISVLVEKLSGAQTSVFKISMCRFAPARLIETIQMGAPSRKSEIKTPI